MAERPVIALVSDAVHPWHRGGKEMRYHELSRRLARRARVDVYTMRWWGSGSEQRLGDVTFHAICRHLPLYAGERRSIPQAVVFAAACARLLGRRFDVLEADAIPFFQLYVLRLVAGLKRRRLVATWHEVWGPDYWREYLGPAGRLAWLVERTAMRLPDEIIAASDETAQRLRAELGPDAAVTVAPNGIDLDAVRAAPAAPHGSDLVVVGRLLSHKRVDLLLDTVAELHARAWPVTLSVIGDGPEREALERRARDLGIAEAVRFRTDVHDQGALYGELKAARVFVFPSEREGFGIAVLEALACGLPVVTTSAPDNLATALAERSAIGRVCAPEPRAMADAVERVLLGQERRDPEAWVSDYDWDTVGDRVLGAMLR